MSVSQYGDQLLSPCNSQALSFSRLALFKTPFVTLIMLLFYQETSIASNYNIKGYELIYFTIFGIITIPFSLAMDMFLVNSQELFWGWKMYDYVAYQDYRFSVRENRWQMSSFETLDESIAEPLQSIDMMCFSDQFFFMSSLHAYGMILGIFGVSAMIRNEYQFFSDPMMIPIAATTYTMCRIVQALSLQLADQRWVGFIFMFGWNGIWERRSLQGTVDDEIAAKLAIGEGRQEDLEAERLELQAMNSERFRHRFLAKSRPWVLQHLVELLTPRTLQMPGADGRPNIEFIRDVYMDLMNDRFNRRDDDNPDISDDDGEDEQERARRNWSNAPLTKSAAEILKWWLKSARKRRTLMKLVRGQIDRSLTDKCHTCGVTAASGRKMKADLANDQGDFDPHAIDALIKSFDERYPDMEFDANLWQAHFRQKATFVTRCVNCINRLEKVLNKKARRAPGAGQRTRAGDISSDDELELMAAFEPTVVARSSTVGRTMKKWLDAARKRLGGVSWLRCVTGWS